MKSFKSIFSNQNKLVEMVTDEPSFSHPVCQLMTINQFFEPNFKKWACEELGWQFGFNRKLWEYAFILNALDVYKKMDGYGLGFGVGQEPIVPVMLRYGAKLLVSDLADTEAQEKGWAQMKFNVSKTDALKFRFVNMNNIPEDLTNYDFLWSCGSFEHIGGLENGLQFVEKAMQCLKPGGIAVHTTEFNLTSNEETLESPGLSLYREKDIRILSERLCDAGYSLKLNTSRGKHQLDELFFDETPPWELTTKEKIGKYTFTSIGLIIIR